MRHIGESAAAGALAGESGCHLCLAVSAGVHAGCGVDLHDASHAVSGARPGGALGGQSA